MSSKIFDDYLIRPMRDNAMRVYYPRIFSNRRKGYTPIGDFELEKINGRTLREIDAEIKSKCEKLIEEHLAGLN